MIIEIASIFVILGILLLGTFFLFNFSYDKYIDIKSNKKYKNNQNQSKSNFI